jgi:aryl-alcohol dehydrogenase (NADP+)
VDNALQAGAEGFEAMQTRNLGTTGLSVSRLVLGTMTFGLQTDERTSGEILNAATGAGINFLDLADVYPLGGDLATAGRTEEIVGRWLEGRRHRYIIATKAVGKMGPAPWDEGASRKHLLDAVDASLRRLKTDYIDLYQLHSDDRSTPLEETLQALDDIVRAGKVRYVRVSNFLAYRLALALGKAEANRWTRFVSVQPRYNLLFREIERELLPLSREAGLGVIPYNPLAGGLLTGKDAPGDRARAGLAAQVAAGRAHHRVPPGRRRPLSTPRRLVRTWRPLGSRVHANSETLRVALAGLRRGAVASEAAPPRCHPAHAARRARRVVTREAVRARWLAGPERLRFRRLGSGRFGSSRSELEVDIHVILAPGGKA